MRFELSLLLIGCGILATGVAITLISLSNVMEQSRYVDISIPAGGPYALQFQVPQDTESLIISTYLEPRDAQLKATVRGPSGTSPVDYEINGRTDINVVTEISGITY